MGRMQLTFLGTGDAFGSGGRLHSSALVQADLVSFLVDCGPSTLASLRGRGLDPGAIDLIVLTHLHGDHFGGVPFFIMDAHYASGRTRPLVVAGPPGLEARIRQAHEVLFPGSGHMPVRFPLAFVELTAGRVSHFGPLAVLPFLVAHSSDADCALRLACDGRVVTFSGDTEWIDTLVEACRDADLFVCECFGFASAPPRHLDYRTLQARRHELTCRRLLLTHMGEDMLREASVRALDTTYDGLVVDL